MQLKNRFNGEVAEVFEYSKTPGANIVQWRDQEGTNQQWTLVKVSPSSVTVNSTIIVKAGQVFDGKGRTYIARSAMAARARIRNPYSCWRMARR